MQRGLVVIDIMGPGVNLVTGDYSRGASGFWVENGEIAYPVEEIIVVGNLASMVNALIAAVSDIETRRNIQVLSLLIDGMTVAGELFNTIISVTVSSVCFTAVEIIMTTCY